MTVLVIAAVLAGCGNKWTGEALAWPPPSLIRLPAMQTVIQPTVQPTFQPTVQPTFQLTLQPTSEPTIEPTVKPTPTPFVLGPLFDSHLTLSAGPVDVPLELKIPSLKVNAPVLGVGLTSENVMDAPKGPIGDSVWHKAFWYRGSGIPGEVGTATIAGHVDDQLGRPEIFAHLQQLHPGDLIIIRLKNTSIDIRFVVDQVKVYSTQESLDPAVLTQIYGAGPVTGTGPQPSLDGLAHLTLITCAGNYVNGQFDHHTVVYATRVK